VPDERAQAQCVRQRAEGRRQGRPARVRAVLPSAGGDRRPRRRRLPLHRYQGQRARHQAQPPRRPQAHPQQVRQVLPRRLQVPQLSGSVIRILHGLKHAPHGSLYSVSLTFRVILSL
jgi:hypothetical protein